MIPFHSYRTRFRKGVQTRLRNCFASQVPPEGKEPIGVTGCAGIVPFSTFDRIPSRGALEAFGYVFSVVGTTLYRVDQSGSGTAVGSVGSGPVDMDRNQSQVAILTAPHLYVYEDGTLTQVTDTDFTTRNATRMAVLDNYGGFIEGGSGRWFICDLATFTAFDALDFATAEGNPDNLLSIESNSRQFVLFGEKSIEIWDNVGGSGFPFIRVPNGYLENGCGAARSTCTADNTVYWIDQDRIARRLEGITPRRISTDGVEQQWQDYPTIADAYSFSYVFDGHTFVIYTFPTAGKTWAYDINTQEWHERDSYGLDYWRAAWVIKAFDKTLVGDTETGDIGQMRTDAFTEWGNPLVREATTGVIYDQKRWIHHDRLELDMEVGQGGQVMLEMSNDGGLNFDGLPSRSLGAVGEFDTVIDWNRIGRSKERVYRIRVSDPVPFAINGIRLDAR